MGRARGTRTAQEGTRFTLNRAGELYRKRYWNDEIFEVVDRLATFVEGRRKSLVHVALAWVLAQGDDIVPNSGTKRARYLDENLVSAQVQITPEELERIDAILPAGATAGERYHPQALQALDR